MRLLAWFPSPSNHQLLFQVTIKLHLGTVACVATHFVDCTLKKQYQFNFAQWLLGRRNTWRQQHGWIVLTLGGLYGRTVSPYDRVRANTCRGQVTGPWAKSWFEELENLEKQILQKWAFWIKILKNWNSEKMAGR